LHNNAGSPRHEQTLVDRLGKKEPEFGSYAGQLGTAHGAQQSVVHLMGHPAPSREGVRRTNHGRSFDRRDVWVGLKPTARLRTSRTCRGPSERQRRKRKKKLLLSKWRSLLKKCLTGPTLLEMSGNGVYRELPASGITQLVILEHDFMAFIECIVVPIDRYPCPAVRSSRNANA
jgi:hypothetical protein